MKRSFIQYITYALAAVVVILCGCADDMLDYGGGIIYPEGETDVKMNLQFDAFTESQSSTRSLPGNSMDRLDDLCLLAYDRDGNLMEGFPVQITKADHNLNVTDEKRTDNNASNDTLAEATTWRATFDVRLPYGNYWLYGVANLGERDKNGNLTKSTFEALKEGKLAEDIKKRQTLLEHRRAWDNTNKLNNFEMLGTFTDKKSDKSPSTGEDMNNARVSIDRPGMQLHAWLRRCISKVTIDFDGAALRENVKIYIRRATIHDIADGCMLGRPNAIIDESEMITFKDKDYLPDASSMGDFIEYGAGEDYSQWPYVTKGSNKLIIANPSADFAPSDKTPDFHGEGAPSLFLYENMQGETEDDRENKVQKPTGDGLVVGADDMKDEVKYGSYIEVEGYYEFNSNAEVSEGKIIYRFMLGKDELKNFDVERNYHIKLTMKPRGNGNDVDWHIVYNTKSGFEWKDPYYVSYLYNHSSTLHFRYNPEPGEKVAKVYAEIVGNNWWPEDPGTIYETVNAGIQSPFTDIELAKNDPLNASFTKNLYPAGHKLAGKRKYLGNGFLSLRQTSKEVLTWNDVRDNVPEGTNQNNWTANLAPEVESLNDEYFYGVCKGSGGIDRGTREYDFQNPDSDPTNTGAEAYSVEKYPDGSLRFNIPVFTRAKNLVKQTAYTGNNPFEGSKRVAYVRVTIEFENGNTKSQVMRVVQVPRIVNPKGIYRSSDNFNGFSVTLMERESESSSIFRAFQSDGPWMAEVLGDANFINLNGRSTIKGSTGSEIAFNIRFNRMNIGTKVRSAIIRVRYHNYTCVHLIFVRQGYDPVAIAPGGSKWHTRNIITENAEALDPRDEGSMFKFGNVTQPIDAINNELIDPLDYYMLPSNANFKPAGALRLAQDDRTPSSTSVKWTDIKASNIAATTLPASPFGKLNIPTTAQFRELIVSPEDYAAQNVNSKMSHGFGVLYADGATSVKTSVNEAYGYKRGGDQSFGMRGVFVYYYDSSNPGDPYNCRSLFFPIGRTGHGQRRANDTFSGGSLGSIHGTLRYCAGRNAAMDASVATNFPLFFDLYRRPGAIYWAKSRGTEKDVTDMPPQDATNEITRNTYQWIALDLNYYTLDVNFLPAGNLQKHSQWSGCSDPACCNACFLRAVEP